MKKYAILLLALVMLISCIPAMADDETPINPTTYTITINIPDDNKAVNHTYEAYQIFTGDLSDPSSNDTEAGTKVILSNIEWGSSVEKYDNKDLSSTNASELAATLIADNNLDDFLKKLDLKSNSFKASEKKENAYVIEGLEPGYYLVKDRAGSLNNVHDAYTSLILEVVENSTVSPKSVYPTVDKQVQDEVADKDADTKFADGWGETADHAINESFKFKLIANLPASTNYDAYKTYKLVFNDSMSSGITFEGIESVTVDGVPFSAEKYTCTAVAGKKGGDWSLTINNIKGGEVNLNDGAEVVVVYNAHLNEDAAIGDEDDNNNTVYLQYSNNPNAAGGGQGGAGGEAEELGQTNTDTVWVFTYEVESTKYKNSIDDANKLDGAGFTLYPSTNGTDKGSAVELVYDSEAMVYRPAPSEPAEGTEVVTQMISANGGIFNIVGLDVGTYIMEETTVPAGYNKCENIVIIIDATHSETADTSASTNITMTVNNTQADINNVVNKSGATLPETGGMGTTLLYVGGGILVLAAIVLLIVKRRASAE